MSKLREALEELAGHYEACYKHNPKEPFEFGLLNAAENIRRILTEHPEPETKIEWGVAVDHTYASCKCWHGIAYIPVSANSREDAQRIIDQTIWQKTSTPHIVKRVAGVSAGPWEPAGHEEREEA